MKLRKPKNVRLTPLLALAFSMVLLLLGAVHHYPNDVAKSISTFFSIDLETENSKSEKEFQEDISEDFLAAEVCSIFLSGEIAIKNLEKKPAISLVSTEVFIPPPEV
jgi:hypothetical protein